MRFHKEERKKETKVFMTLVVFRTNQSLKTNTSFHLDLIAVSQKTNSSFRTIGIFIRGGIPLLRLIARNFVNAPSKGRGQLRQYFSGFYI